MTTRALMEVDGGNVAASGEREDGTHGGYG